MHTVTRRPCVCVWVKPKIFCNLTLRNTKKHLKYNSICGLQWCWEVSLWFGSKTSERRSRKNHRDFFEANCYLLMLLLCKHPLLLRTKVLPKLPSSKTLQTAFPCLIAWPYSLNQEFLQWECFFGNLKGVWMLFKVSFFPQPFLKRISIFFSFFFLQNVQTFVPSCFSVSLFLFFGEEIVNDCSKHTWYWMK